MKSGKNTDITPFNQFEENRHYVEMYFNVIFNNIRDPLFVKDQECRLLLVNDAFCQLFGMSRSEIIGKTLAGKVPSSEMEHFLSIDIQVLEDGKEILCEEALTAGGEQTKIILTRKNRFIDPQGNPFLVGVIHDITERKRTEDKLELAASVFTHAGEGIMITDAAGILVDVNETFTHITGYTSEKVLGETQIFSNLDANLQRFMSRCGTR
jgi:PAS domain S-box-containing protein